MHQSRENSPLVVEWMSKVKVSRAGHPQSILNSNRYATSDVIPALSNTGSANAKSIAVEQYRQLGYCHLLLSRSVQKTGPVPLLAE